MIDTEQLQRMIEEDINPALQMHQGFCVLDGIEAEEDQVPKIFLSFFGGCQGCPSSFDGTLKQIQSYLRVELDMPDLEVINTETT